MKKIAENNEQEKTFIELRTLLRNTFYKELSNLPSVLESLEPKVRAELLVRMMPFILPRPDTLSATAYEKTDFSW